MPSYVPPIGRTAREILQSIVAKVVVRSKLTDVTETAVVTTIAQAVAEELESYDTAVLAYRDAYTFQASGRLLERRVGELPRGGISRQGVAPAAGRSIRVRRGNTVGSLSIPIGSTYGRSDNPDLVYVQTEQVVVPDGQEWYPSNPTDAAIPVTCQRAGEVGNASPGTVTVALSVPGDVVEVRQTKPIAGGRPEETDAQLRHRAELYLASLVGVQPDALESLARNYTSPTTGAHFLHAFTWEDPERPAYSELVVDDGAGFEGEQRQGQIVQGIVPENGQRILYFESPAVNAGPDYFQIFRNDELLSEVYGWDNLPYTVVEERGVVYVDEGVFAPGDVWTITAYRVYTGLIRELQRVVEGRPLGVVVQPGHRASGCRVRVVPPRVQWVSFDLKLLLDIGVSDLASVRADVKTAIVNFLAALPPGQPLLLKQLNCTIVRVPGVRSYEMPSPLGDLYPSDFKTALRTQNSLIKVT